MYKCEVASLLNSQLSFFSNYTTGSLIDKHRRNVWIGKPSTIDSCDHLTDRKRTGNDRVDVRAHSGIR